MNKTGIIIQARMASTRLPNKIMLDLCGKPLLWHVVERCKRADIDEVIIATSTNKENDIIEEFCEKNNYKCFRGSEDDVLNRYYKAAKKFKLDIIVRVTSDCPLIAPEIINRAIDGLKKGNGDYVSNASIRSYPRGLDVEVFTFDVLEKAHKLTKDKFQREHVTAFIYNNPQMFKIGSLIVKGLLKKPDIRICVDTKEDFELLKIIYNKFYNCEIIPIMKVMTFLNKNPELAKMNIESEKEHLEKSKDLKQKFIDKNGRKF